MNSTKVSEGLSYFEKHQVDLIITDYRLPDGTGMEILDQVLNDQPTFPVILITNYSDIRTAVKSMKMGAFEYITKPIQPDELLLTVQQALKTKASTGNLLHKQNKKNRLLINFLNLITKLERAKRPCKLKNTLAW